MLSQSVVVCTVLFTLPSVRLCLWRAHAVRRNLWLTRHCANALFWIAVAVRTAWPRILPPRWFMLTLPVLGLQGVAIALGQGQRVVLLAVAGTWVMEAMRWSVPVAFAVSTLIQDGMRCASCGLRPQGAGGLVSWARVESW